jgi:hypothetical protein
MLSGTRWLEPRNVTFRYNWKLQLWCWDTRTHWTFLLAKWSSELWLWNKVKTDFIQIRFAVSPKNLGWMNKTIFVLKKLDRPAFQHEYLTHWTSVGDTWVIGNRSLGSRNCSCYPQAVEHDSCRNYSWIQNHRRLAFLKVCSSSQTGRSFILHLWKLLLQFH